MVFNSISFLFWFLPVFLVAYYLCKLRFRPALLLIASLFVYAWGSTESLVFLLCFIALNWTFSLLLEKHANALALAVVCDIAFLCLFKYMKMSETLPLGASFYSLSGISYCIDVARGTSRPAKNPAKLALFLSFFPKMTMGPIVKYSDFAPQLELPCTNSDMAADGMLHFSIGLAKKLVIAASLSGMTANCWLDAPYSTASAWLGIIGFSLQLYYDFSGYSDMAIGLSQVLGFEIKENFIYPYQSKSLAEFWSRWHISLSSWFRDYVYFPLGGNRRGKARTALNMLIVWLITGLWHGNGLNFICWGLFLFLCTSIEKQIPHRDRLPAAAGIILSDLAVMTGWVFFNSKSPADAASFISCLLGGAKALSSGTAEVYFNQNFPLLFIAAVGCTSFPKLCVAQLFPEDRAFSVVAKCVFVLALLAASTVCLVTLGYTPFIYQSF